MKVPVELAYLNGPHFHVLRDGGVSLGDRLDTRDKKRAGMTLEWDTETKELAVTYSGRVGYVVSSNVKAYFPFEGHKVRLAAIEKLEKAVEENVKAVVDTPVKVPHQTKISAQVSTPQDHVFAGPGGGKTK